MEADSYPTEWKNRAYEVCDIIRTKGLKAAEAAAFFDKEMKERFLELSQTKLDDLFSWGMHASR